MKRMLITLDQMAQADNLALACWKAAKGKRSRPDVAAFLTRVDRSLAALSADILAARVPYGRFRSFVIHDPKKRQIHAACFEDRVLHHAILNLAEPAFEAALVPSSYACRPGRGVHSAVAYAQRLLRRFTWFGKGDVDGYFPAIDHGRLIALLARRFKGADFLDLLWRIVESHHATPGKGLPIGALTSQHFANHYLAGADRFLLDHPAVCGHVRYMDDILWWCRSKDDTRAVRDELASWLHRERGLCLKPSVQINRSAHGVTYCGYRVSVGAIRLTPRKRRRYAELRAKWEAAWHAGLIDDLGLQRGYDAAKAITLFADSASWRRQQLARCPVRYSGLRDEPEVEGTLSAPASVAQGWSSQATGA
jgi:RNA-directed DNA polymerase